MSAQSFTARSLPTGAGLTRLALRLDAVVTGANAVAYLIAAGPIGELLGVPEAALRGVGAFLAVFAVAVWLAAAPERPSATAVWAIAAANVLWAVDSIALIAFGWWSPTTAGTVWIALQAAVVAGFAVFQSVAQRRAAVSHSGRHAPLDG